MSTRAAVERDRIEYPESDGKPMAESDLHRDAMFEAIELLKEHFAPRAAEVYVSGNNFVYYAEGDRRAVVSPDIYVVHGVAQRRRRVYKLWEEGGRAPSFVLEVSSKSTRAEDLGEKMMRYRDDLRVPEYFVFDPLREWVEEGLRGYRLAEGIYVPVRPLASARLPSRELGLEFGHEGDRLTFYLPGVDRPLETAIERAARAQEEAARAQEEAARAQEEAARAQEEAARERAERQRLEAELTRLRGPDGPPGGEGHGG